MLRISEIGERPGSVTLRVEGRLTGPWVDELRRVSVGVLASHNSVTLDLADMSYLDARGLSLLRELASQSVTLANCSPFVSEQFKEMEDD